MEDLLRSHGWAGTIMVGRPKPRQGQADDSEGIMWTRPYTAMG